MNNSTLLSLTTTSNDKVICEECKMGIMLPTTPDFKINHSFTCSYCRNIVNIDLDVEIE